MNPKNFSIVCAVLLFLGSTAPVQAADLTADQQAVVADVVTQLNKATDNYNLAAKTAGPGTEPPKGSKAKLAAIRLESATKMLPPAAAKLADLPADNAAVQAAQKQYDAIADACAKLQERLNGKPAPPTPKQPAPTDPVKPNTPDKPAPPAAEGVKLDYKQEKLLKDARFHLNELEGFNKKLAAWATKAAAVKDKSTIQWSDAQAIGELVAKAKTRVEYSGNAIKQLPGNGRGVAEQAGRRSILSEQLAGEMKKIQPIYAYLAKLVNPSTYPTLAADLQRMRGLSQIYSDTGVLTRDAEQSAAAIKQGPAAWAEFQKFAKVYGPLSNQTSEFGKQVRGAGMGFANRYKAFATAVQETKNSLPPQIDQHLANAAKDADVAVAQKKPLFFTGGVKQKMDWARDKTALLAAVDEPAGKQYDAKIAAAEANIKKKQELLRDDIIAANRMPNDNYSHPDRKVIEAKAIAEWKKREPNAKILAVRMPVENWKRKRTLWLRDRTITETDASHLQVQLIVQHDAKLAVIRPINLSKDHTMNDQLKASPFDAESEKVSDLRPARFLLLKNVK